MHFQFQYKTIPGQSLTLLTKVLDKNVKPEYPLRFTVRFDHGSTSWEIPYGVGNKFTPNGWSVKNIDFFTNEISRSLCLLNYSQKISLTIVISTSNVDNIRFNMKFLIELIFFCKFYDDNFQIFYSNLGFSYKSKTIQIT